MFGLKELLVRALFSDSEIVGLGLRPLPRLAYERLQRAGFKPGGIVDIGAYRGNWSIMARRVFPDVSILMIEAREEEGAHLDKLAKSDDLTDYRISLVTSSDRDEMSFTIWYRIIASS